MSKPDSALGSLTQRLMSALAAAGQAPRFGDLSRIGPLHMACVYNERHEQLFDVSAGCGMDLNRDLAIVKSIVEWIERSAVRKSGASTSDGHAGFPIVDRMNDAATRARSSAMYEAIERYCWSVWWDNPSIQARITELNDASVSDLSSRVLDSIYELVPFNHILLVRPEIEARDVDLQIYVALLKCGGVITAGACGAAESREETALRALGELARHAAGACRILGGTKVESFYEKRLSYMVTGPAQADLQRRITANGTAVIKLPNLMIDDVVDHDLAHLVVVHRCLFEGQPDFLGGALERLCL